MALLFQSFRKVFPGICYKSGLVIGRAPDLFLRWCNSDFLCYFHDNPRRDWHDGLTVSPWP